MTMLQALREAPINGRYREAVASAGDGQYIAFQHVETGRVTVLYEDRWGWRETEDTDRLEWRPWLRAEIPLLYRR